MTGQIPKYGKNFRRESVPYERDRDLASTIYVLKAEDGWHIRSNKASNRWFVFVETRTEDLILGGPYRVMRDAMRACIDAHAALAEGRIA